jgi:YesN/AraC family two-component response regulator
MPVSPLRVAIADDDRSMRELLEGLLHKLGHEVVAICVDGQSLISQAAITEPDVIITDNLMPDISGVDAAAIIYQQKPTQIILLSGYCDRELVLDAEQNHVLMYLVKPVSQAHLEAALLRCQELRDSGDNTPTDDEERREYQVESARASSATIYRSPPAPPYPQVRRPR